MPLLLRCDELEAGMRLSEALIWRGRTLLTAGRDLSPADVGILRGKFPDVLVRVGDPIFDNLLEFQDDSKEREVATTTQRMVVRSMSQVSERFSSRASLRSMNVQALHQSVAEVMHYLSNNPVSTAILARSLDTEGYMSEHAGNVFYLSMLLGGAVRDYVDSERRRTTSSRWLSPEVTFDLLPLGLGAMLADVGMLPLQHLYAKREGLTEEERKAIREHPTTGCEMLPKELSAAARAVVRTHHENCDGSGYPNGMAGGQIHVFSRIVRIADAFDAATARHVYRQAKSAARALWEMSAGPNHVFYDPVLMKVFTSLIQPFPIGAKLRLRDGRYAVVVRYNRQAPFAPNVVIAFDSNGQRLPNEKLEGPICLVNRPDLRLQSFGDEQLSYLHSAQSAMEPAPSRKEFASLFEAVFP